MKAEYVTENGVNYSLWDFIKKQRNTIQHLNEEVERLQADLLRAYKNWKNDNDW